MTTQLFKITQNVIIQNQEKAVLILKHNTGKWLLPGGKIQKGESWIDALKREIKEETKITEFEVKKILDIDSWTENEIGYYVATFVAQALEADKITLSDEHIDYAWVKLSDLDNYDFWHENIKKRIKKALL
ncbi:NUDIX hydrolase [Patescibacteria group bacterium]|nr:NUDIX hydrolase [Patescibacteria group bacterium]MBU4031087.1 NUDIX hydrolase [Patescibacteria group bacterium]MCG2699748.1 NUDIX hydrolase [Candidatus Parcubacteria bacterium]